jgi:hypothetical protein
MIRYVYGTRTFTGLVAALGVAGCLGEDPPADDDLATDQEAVSSNCSISIAAQEAAVTLGQAIHFSATASCLVGTPEVQWYHKVNSSWQNVASYSAATALSFDSTGSVVGPNYFMAAVRQQGTTTPIRASNTVGVTVNDNVPSCTSVKLTSPIAGATGNAGSPMALAGSAVCPVGVVPEYQFWVKLSTTSSWTILPGYTTTTSSWTPPTSGTWNVRAASRAQGAHVAYQVLSGSASVAIAGPANRAPIAINDDLTTAANSAGSVNVLGNDSDPDGDGFSVTSFTQGTSGSVGFAGSVATYTPAADFVGTDFFVYTITDGHGATAWATVFITVNNLPPTAVDDTLATPANMAGSVDVLLNDSDADHDAFSVTSFTQGTSGTVGFAGSVATYTPAADFVGSDSFTYTVTDANGGSATATVNVTVTNLGPAANDDLISTAQNTPGSVDVLLNDVDGNHDALTVTSYTQGAHGSVSFSGSLATYTPALSYTGADAFGYTITDAHGATATATVNVSVRSTTPGCAISIANTTSGPIYGSTMHLMATASCNTGPADIQWYHKENSSWRIVQVYSSSTTLDITASMVGNDYYYALARTHGTTTPVATSNTLAVVVADNVPSCTSVKMTQPVSNTIGHVGVEMTLAASATCPAGVTPEYQFWIKLSTSSSWTILPGYTQTTGSWTPPSTGTWNIKAAARAVGAHVSYQVLSSANTATISP